MGPDDPRDRVFLTDFGLAKDVTAGSRYTRTGETLGTRPYMSPELARGEVNALVPASDVWALGCVLYECLAGRPAIEGDSPGAVVGAVLVSEPVALQRVRADSPVAVGDAVARCLAKRSGDRFPDAGALARALTGVLAGVRPVGAGRRRRSLAAVGLLLAAAGVVGAVLATRSTDPDAVTNPARRSADAADAEAPAIAARARAIRFDAPGRSAAMFAEAIALDPRRHDWRIERGVLLWRTGDRAGAEEAWAAIPADSPAAPEARLLRLLMEFFGFGLAADAQFRRFDLVLAVEADGGDGARIARALRALSAHDWDTARDSLSGITGPAAALARAYLETGVPDRSPERADREYTTAFVQGMRFDWAVMNRAAARAALGRFEDARADYTAVLRKHPRYLLALRSRGAVLRELGNDQAALADLDAVLELSPTDVPARRSRARLHWQAGRPHAAIDDFDLLTAGGGLRPYDLIERAQAWMDLGEFARARADCDSALTRDPALRDAKRVRMLALLRLRAYAEALSEADAVLASGPPDAEMLNARGAIRLESGGDPSRAHRDFHAALALDPSAPVPRLNRARARLRLGRLDGALEDLARVLATDPGDPDGLGVRAQVRVAQRRFDEAAADLERALQRRPRSPRFWTELGIARGLGGKEAEAIAAYRHALTLDPNIVPALGNLALSQRAAGHYAEALALFERLLRVAPNHPTAASVRRHCNDCRTRLREGR